jgi:uracil-DNA glycosylase
MERPSLFRGLPPSWQSIARGMDAGRLASISDAVLREYELETVYPPQDQLFEAFGVTSFEQTSVVIVGQDPYILEGQAQGMSFSVPEGVKIPPSLGNIFKELESDLGCPAPSSGDLHSWAQQGVLLLNSILTVRAGESASHKHLGWEYFTDSIISALGKREQPLVCILWGTHAQKKASLIHSHHFILESVHPSPLSAYRGFFGRRPFSRANAFLVQNGQEPINWCLHT